MPAIVDDTQTWLWKRAFKRANLQELFSEESKNNHADCVKLNQIKMTKSQGIYHIDSKQFYKLGFGPIIFNEAKIDYKIRAQEEDPKAMYTTWTHLASEFYPKFYDRWVTLWSSINEELITGLWLWILGKDQTEYNRGSLLDKLRDENLWDLVNNVTPPVTTLDAYMGELQLILKDLFGYTKEYDVKVRRTKYMEEVKYEDQKDRADLLSNLGLTEHFIKLLSLISRINLTLSGPIYEILEPIDFTCRVTISFDCKENCAEEDGQARWATFLRKIWKIVSGANKEVVTITKDIVEERVPSILFLTDCTKSCQIIVPFVLIKTGKHGGLDLQKIKKGQEGTIEKFWALINNESKLVDNLRFKAVKFSQTPPGVFVASHST